MMLEKNAKNSMDKKDKKCWGFQENEYPKIYIKDWKEKHGFDIQWGIVLEQP